MCVCVCVCVCVVCAHLCLCGYDYNNIFAMIGWWYVFKTDPDQPDCGYVPSSFLKPIGSPDIPSDPQHVKDCLGFVVSNIFDSTSNPDETESPNTSLVETFMKYVAIDSYESKDERTLSFPDGAILIIIEQSEDGEWVWLYEGVIQKWHLSK